MKKSCDACHAETCSLCTHENQQGCLAVKYTTEVARPLMAYIQLATKRQRQLGYNAMLRRLWCV